MTISPAARFAPSGGTVAEPSWELGAKTTLLPGPEICLALGKGSIDVAGHCCPAVTFTLGFNQVTTYIGMGPPGFLATLFANAQGREARESESEMANIVSSARRGNERLGPMVEGADARPEKLRADLAAAKARTLAENRAKHTLEKAEHVLVDESARLDKARTGPAEAVPRLQAATTNRASWANVAFGP